MRKVSLTFCFVIFFGCLLFADAPTVRSMKSGFAGGFKAGCWHPVRVVIGTGDSSFKGVIQVRVAESVFEREVELPSHSTVKVDMDIILWQLGEPITLQLIPEPDKGEIFQFPSPVKQFTERLVPVPDDKRFVAILGEAEFARALPFFSPDDFYSLVVAERFIPQESYRYEQFDVLIIPPASWRTLEQRRQEAVQEYARCGGAIFFTSERHLPLELAPDVEIPQIGQADWGLGQVISISEKIEPDMLAPAEIEKIRGRLIAMLERKSYAKHRPVSATAYNLFERPVWFGQMRYVWLCSLLLYAGFVVALGVMVRRSGLPRKRAVMLFIASAAVVSALFLLFGRDESRLAVRTCRISFGCTGSTFALQQRLTELSNCSHSDLRGSLPVSRAASVKLIYPDWNAHITDKWLLSYRKDIAEVAVEIAPGGRRIVACYEPCEAVGSVKMLRTDNGVPTAFLNDSGRSLTGCILTDGSRGAYLGELAFGDTATAAGQPALLDELVRKEFPPDDADGRLRQAIIKLVLTRLISGEAYLLGWESGSEITTLHLIHIK